MATRITVTVKGPLGLDEADTLRADLERATGVPWRSEPTGTGPHLGAAELLLAAVVSGVAGKAGEMALTALTEQVRKVVHHLRAQHFTPPEIIVAEEQVPAAGAVGGTADGGTAESEGAGG